MVRRMPGEMYFALIFSDIYVKWLIISKGTHIRINSMPEGIHKGLYISNLCQAMSSRLAGTGKGAS